MRLRRSLVLAIVTLVAVLAATLWALPGWLKQRLEHEAGAALGRPVSIDRLALHWQRLAVTVEGLRVAGPAPAAPPLLKVARMELDASAASLWKRAVVVEALRIEQPEVALARTGEGRFDVDDLIARLSQPAAAPAEPAAVPRFVLQALVVEAGRLRFDDQPFQRVHTVEGLQLSLPFVSSLDDDRHTPVAPRLAFRFDGTAFDSAAEATPFLRPGPGRVTLAFRDLDLAPWHAYLPARLPLRPVAGRLSAELQARFDLAEHGLSGLVIDGRASADAVRLDDAPGREFAGWDGLELELAELRPFDRRVALTSVALRAPRIALVREADGRLRLPAAAGEAAAPEPPAAPWQVTVKALQLDAGRIRFDDAGTRPAARYSLQDLALRATALQWPGGEPAAWEGSARLQAQGQDAGRLALQGRAGVAQARLGITLEGLPLEAGAPYMAGVLRARLAGRAAAQLTLEWDAEPARMRLLVDRLALQGVQLGERGQPGGRATLEALQLEGAQVDLGARRVALRRLALARPSLLLSRNGQGRWNVQDWLQPAVPAAGPAAAPDAGPAWQLALDELAMDEGRLRLADARPAPDPAAPGAPAVRPVAAELRLQRLRARTLAWPATAPVMLELLAQLGQPAAGQRVGDGAGAIEWRGRVQAQPLRVAGDLRLQSLPLHLFEPYVAAQLPVVLRRADLGWRGRVELSADAGGPLRAQLEGDGQLADVKVLTRAAGDEELLAWQALSLQGLKAELAPPARPRVALREVVLSEFFARLGISPEGRFNLQDLARPAADAAAPAAVPAPAASAAAQAAAPPLPFDLEVGGVRLENGRVDFNDRLVRPNYSADLTEVNGRIGAFSASAPEQMAEVQLTARAARTAKVEVIGRVNPGARPPQLDIRARASDLELAPLSPYAAKYAGYAIERGKLSMTLAYRIDAQGRLEASNQVVVHQLSFGEKVESPQATSLPVRLAAALLQDRNGVIDLDLPVSGSLDDPEFSLASVIWKVVGNLIVKAVSFPFALFSGGGGGAEAGSVAFDAGTVLLSAEAQQSLQKVAQAMLDRPSLKLTITGSADPAAERDAVQRSALEERLRAERRRLELRSGVGSGTLPAAATAPAAAAGPPAPITGPERERLLRSLYRESELPDRPRNALGFLRELPADEMERRLLPAMPVGDEVFRQLALQRAVAVRDALAARGLAGERVFLAAPQAEGGVKADLEIGLD